MTAWERTTRIFKWFLLNGTWYFLGTLGAVAGVAWAWNIFAFCTWLLFSIVGFIASMVLLSHFIEKPIVIKYETAMPVWIDMTTDAMMGIICAATGHWFYGTLIFLHIISYNYILAAVKPKPEYPGATAS